MKTVVVIAPHPDDETLGCGGTLLRHVATGDVVHWVIVTQISEDMGFTSQRVTSRAEEIEAVAQAYGFSQVHRLGFPSMRLDQISKLDLVLAISKVIQTTSADTLYIPYRNDAHSDHAVVFDAAVACVKTFRYPSVKSVYVYETLSETEFGLRTDDFGFRPNLFIDIERWLEPKIAIMSTFVGEMALFPFPRSEVCMRAQSSLRGSQAGVNAAEAFMVLKEIR